MPSPFSSGFSSGFAAGVTTDTTTVTVNALQDDTERVYGYSFAEDSSATAVVKLRAGSVSGQVVVGPIGFVADESKLVMLEKNVFWEFPGNCYVEEVSGSVVGVLYVRNV